MIRIPLLALCLVASSAAAQTVSQDAASTFSPADPSKTRPVQYRSVFGSDRSADPAAKGDWRQVNDEMARLRGHAGQIRDDAASESRDAAPATAPGGTQQSQRGQ